MPGLAYVQCSQSAASPAVRTWLPQELKPSGRDLVVITDGKVGRGCPQPLTFACPACRCRHRMCMTLLNCHKLRLPDCNLHALRLHCTLACASLAFARCTLLLHLAYDCRASTASWRAWIHRPPHGAAALGNPGEKRNQNCLRHRLCSLNRHQLVQPSAESFSAALSQGAHRQLRDDKKAWAARSSLWHRDRGRVTPPESEQRRFRAAEACPVCSQPYLCCMHSSECVQACM